MTYQQVALRFLASVVLLSATSAMASILTVNKSSGPYTSVNAALADATIGDVIEITDNSSTYTENLYITKDNITIRGQAGLDPKPLIQGVQQVHPLANSLSAPQQWFWNEGMANSADKLFDAQGAVVVNASVGLKLQNLAIKCEPTSATTGTSSTGLLDFRFGHQGLVENCYLDGSGLDAKGQEVAGANVATLTANDHTFTSCTFYRGNITLQHEGGAGTLHVVDCLVTAPVHAIYIYGGTALFENTSINYLRVSGSATAVEVGNTFGNVNATFRGCAFRKLAPGSTGDMFGRFLSHDRSATYGQDTYASGRWSTGTIECVYDNCDFIGGPGQAHTRAFDMGTGSGRVNWILKSFRVVDCNFYNIAGPIYNAGGDVPFPGNQYQLPGEQDIFEDYNCYKQCLNTAVLSGMKSGGHSVACNLGQPLYVDAANGDFRVASNSPAATLNSTATPAYSGSFGVASGVTVPVLERTIAHSGGDFSSVQAALSAAKDGELLTITDNSAPYVENVDFCNGKNGVTLRAQPGLSPRPVLKAPGDIVKPYAFVVKPPSTPITHNTTIQGLEFDATATSGTNSTVFENFSTYTVTLVQDCKFVGGASTWFGFNVEDNHSILENCEVNKPYSASYTAFLKRKTRNCAMTSCTITSGDKAIQHYGGKLLARNCAFAGGNASQATILVDYTSAYSTSQMLEFYDTLVRSTTPSNSSQPLIKYVSSGTHRRNVVFDNCDLVGSLAGYPDSKPVATCFDLNGPLVYANVKDCAFFNFATTAFDLHSNTNETSIPGITFNPKLGFEDYNVYKMVANTLDAQGCTRGTHDVYMDIYGVLYSDVLGGDFRLDPSSPAATLNSTGTPAYVGSQGIGVAAKSACKPDWSMYQ